MSTRRKPPKKEGYLAGELLVAMPGMNDPRFVQTVIYVCVHDENGAMGIVLNRLLNTMTFTQLLQQVELTVPASLPVVPVHFGGPVESGRGFVLHTLDYQAPATYEVSEAIGLTATVDILDSIASRTGPDRYIVALGYAGWAAGQLEKEMLNNGWLTVAADEELLFTHETELKQKWHKAISKLGFSADKLTGDSGHA